MKQYYRILFSFLSFFILSSTQPGAQLIALDHASAGHATTGQVDQAGQQCSICIDTLEDAAHPNSCDHLFCRECITQWQQTHAGTTSCPLCRTTFTHVLPAAAPREPNRMLGGLFQSNPEPDQAAIGNAPPPNNTTINRRWGEIQPSPWRIGSRRYYALQAGAFTTGSYALYKMGRYKSHLFELIRKKRGILDQVRSTINRLSRSGIRHDFPGKSLFNNGYQAWDAYRIAPSYDENGVIRRRDAHELFSEFEATDQGKNMRTALLLFISNNQFSNLDLTRYFTLDTEQKSYERWYRGMCVMLAGVIGAEIVYHAGALDSIDNENLLRIGLGLAPRRRHNFNFLRY